MTIEEERGNREIKGSEEDEKREKEVQGMIVESYLQSSRLCECSRDGVVCVYVGFGTVRFHVLEDLIRLVCEKKKK